MQQIAFPRDLMARNRSEATITTYLLSLRIFSEFIIQYNLPQTIENITREHIEEFINDLLQTHKPAVLSQPAIEAYGFSLIGLLRKVN